MGNRRISQRERSNHDPQAPPGASCLAIIDEIAAAKKMNAAV